MATVIIALVLVAWAGLAIYLLFFKKIKTCSCGSTTCGCSPEQLEEGEEQPSCCCGCSGCH